MQTLMIFSPFLCLPRYPFTFKFLWSPIVDAVFSSKIGRRKTWVIPTQLLIAVGFFLLAAHLESPDSILNAGNTAAAAAAASGNGGSSGGGGSSSSSSATGAAMYLTVVFFAVMILAATQDIAVDAWALTMLSKENVGLASSCQSIGMTLGSFTSYTVFLSLSSAEFCSRYLGAQEPLLSLPGYLKGLAVLYVAVTALVAVKREDPEDLEHLGADDTLALGGVTGAYRSMARLLALRGVRAYLPISLLSRVAFAAVDGALTLKLVSIGFRREGLAGLAVVQLPAEIAFTFFAGRWSRGASPLAPYWGAYKARLALAALGPAMVLLIPHQVGGQEQPGYLYAVVLAASLCSSFASTVMMVSQGAFFNKVADPALGGTYITVLNSISNAGTSWPRFFVLNLIGLVDNIPCLGPNGPVSPADAAAGSSSALQCSTETLVTQCHRLGGNCVAVRDGFLIVSVVSIVLGVLYVISFTPRVEAVQRLPKTAWRIESAKSTKGGRSVRMSTPSASRRRKSRERANNEGDEDFDDDHVDEAEALI
jgi:PAT family acetyl-CoA transporter-like MFS transporter 1